MQNIDFPPGREYEKDKLVDRDVFPAKCYDKSVQGGVLIWLEEQTNIITVEG